MHSFQTIRHCHTCLVESAAPALVAILAGGAGRRIGGAKPAVRLAGRPLVSYPLAAARAATLEVVVVAKRSSILPPLDCEVVYEPAVPRHPACGILAALDRAAGAAVVAVGADMPFLTAALLRWLARIEGDAVVSVGGQSQPLLARYTPAARPALEHSLTAGAPLRRATEHARVLGEDELARFGDPQQICFAVNEPVDLARAELELLAGQHG